MRLTEKNKMARYGYKYVAPNRFDNFGEGCAKLGQLEDIEDELGIDLITLFKAMKNGIYGKVGNKIEHILAPLLSWNYREIYIFQLKDYGITWALTKEELL